MKKWLFVALALILMPVAVLFAGCSTKDKEVVIRVNDDYVQWAYVGEDEWTNVISIEDIKNALGESYQGEKGEQGEAGVDGRQVEFSKNETHIIWRYVGEDVWHNLVALSEIKGKDGETTISGPKHTVTFDSNGGTEIAPITNVSHLSAISKPKTPTRSGYAFDGWYSDGDLWNFNGCLVSKDITLTAKWNPLFTYTLKDGNATITGLTSFGQNLESICFASSIDGVEVKKVQISPSSNYLKSISFEEGIETIIMRLDGCANLKSVTLPSSCKSIPTKFIHQDNLDIFTKYNGGLYLGTKDNPYFYLEAFDNYDEQKVEIHPNCEILFENFYSSQSFNTIKFDGTMSQFKNKAHFVEQSEQTSGVVYEIECKDGKFLSYDNYIECTYSTGKKVKHKPATRIGNKYYVTSVVISDGITEISAEKFRNFSNLVSITIPNSVTSIGSEAFYDCSNLETIDFVGTVAEFKTKNFDFGLSQLMKVVCADGECFDSDAYFECTYSNGDVKYFKPNNIIINKADVISVAIGDGVTSIEERAFYGCSGLTSVTISRSVTLIANYAFYDCSALTEVHVSDLESWLKISFGLEYSNPLYYAHHLYLNGTELTEIEIPAEATKINSYAFCGASSITSITIPSSITSIGESAFSGCSGLISITIPESVTSIGTDSFYDCSALTEVHILNLVAWFNITFGNQYANPLVYAHHLYLKGTELTEITVPSSITKINDYALYGASAITSVTIPSSVTSIGESAFGGCSELIAITIPKDLTSIGSGVFNNCVKLETINFDGSLSEFKAKKFNFDINRFVKVVCSDGELLNVGECIEYTYSTGGVKYFKTNDTIQNKDKVISVRIGYGVTSIESDAFYGCNKLTSITIPESVTSIGGDGRHDYDGAFSVCSALTEVHISDLKSWFNIKFNGGYSNPLICAHHLYLNGTELTEIEIPAGITKINNFALCGASSIISITIPISVTTIGDYAFFDCSGLTSITIPISVTTIGDYAFSDCSGLTSITIPKDLTSIGYQTFSGCSRLTSITIPDGVTSIGAYAFSDCSGLTSITIPISVTSIGSFAFSGCKKVFCEQGAEPLDWNANWSSGVESVYWYRETKPTEEGNFWHYVDGEPVIW